MSPELERSLFGRYPKLLGRLDWIEVPDTWYDILDELFAKLEPMHVQAVQVKEKFGGLRVYLFDGNEETDDLIREAEAAVLELEDE